MEQTYHILQINEDPPLIGCRLLWWSLFIWWVM